MKILYSGSFNPFHNGHGYVFDLACKMFGKSNVWIGLGNNGSKTVADVRRIVHSIRPITNQVFSYNTLTADVVKEQGFELLVRGVRPGRSLEDENDLLHWNMELCGVSTILIPTPPALNQISSTAIRELTKYNKSVLPYMNPDVFGRWNHKSDGKIEPLVYFGKCCSGKTYYLNENLPNFVEMDKVFWNYISKMSEAQKEKAKIGLKAEFYSKSPRFLLHCKQLYKKFDYGRFFYDFSNVPVIDMPNLGAMWESIPECYRNRMTFVKVSTSEVNRLAFAKARKVNKDLIECNDYFYQDPPFWDKDVII